MAKNIVSINTLIGKTILSRSTGNKLGQVQDLFVDPIKGLLLGLTIQMSNSGVGGIAYNEIYSFGQDAVMVNTDESVQPLADGWSQNYSHAKNLIGTKIITDGGKFLGQIANVYIQLASLPLVIYEVRESLLDKLLGRGFFIPASVGSALSDDAERIVVPSDTTLNAASSLEALTTQTQAAIPDDFVSVQSWEQEETMVRARNVTDQPDAIY